MSLHILPFTGALHANRNRYRTHPTSPLELYLSNGLVIQILATMFMKVHLALIFHESFSFKHMFILLSIIRVLELHTLILDYGHDI